MNEQNEGMCQSCIPDLMIPGGWYCTSGPKCVACSNPPRQPGEMGAGVRPTCSVFDDMLRSLEHVEAVYRLNVVKDNEPSSTLDNLQRVIARAKAASAQQDEREAKFFRWLTDDLAGDERQARNALLEHMAVMSYSAACAAIATAIAESRHQSEQCKQPCERFCACDREAASAQQDEREAVAWITRGDFEGEKIIDWFESDIKDLPLGTKLYIQGDKE